VTVDNQRFEVVSDYQPAGDQPRAISQLAEGIERGDRFQTLLGITGSGKSATVAWTIEKVQRPTLILAPNTTSQKRTLPQATRLLKRTLR